MNVPFLKSLLLTLLLVPAMAGAMEKAEPVTVELPSSETDQRLIYWPCGRQAYDPNSDTFVKEALVLKDYLSLLRNSRIAQVTRGQFVLNIAILLGAWKLFATVAGTG